MLSLTQHSGFFVFFFTVPLDYKPHYLNSSLSKKFNLLSLSTNILARRVVVKAETVVKDFCAAGKPFPETIWKALF